ncbi:tyrosine-protein phosphatase required for protection against superoxide stress (By similarity), partial [Kappamyces sp. JEL0680]
QPNELNFPFLETLGLKKILFLAPEDPSQRYSRSAHARFLNFVDDQDIELHHLGYNQIANAWDPISEEVVLEALELILNPKHYPLMVMCNQGRHRTGTVIGCLRKLQRWNLTSIFEEYRRFAGPKVRVLSEQFIELFDIELVLQREAAQCSREIQLGNKRLLHKAESIEKLISQALQGYVRASGREFIVPDMLVRDATTCLLLDAYANRSEPTGDLQEPSDDRGLAPPATTLQAIRIFGNGRGRHHLNSRKVFGCFTHMADAFDTQCVQQVELDGQWIMQPALSRIIAHLPHLQTLKLSRMRITGKGDDLALAVRSLAGLRHFVWIASYCDCFSELLDQIQTVSLQTLVVNCYSYSSPSSTAAIARLLQRNTNICTFEFSQFTPLGHKTKINPLSHAQVQMLVGSLSSAVCLQNLVLQVDLPTVDISALLADAIPRFAALSHLGLIWRSAENADNHFGPLAAVLASPTAYGLQTLTHLELIGLQLDKRTVSAIFSIIRSNHCLVCLELLAPTGAAEKTLPALFRQTLHDYSTLDTFAVAGRALSHPSGFRGLCSPLQWMQCVSSARSLLLLGLPFDVAVMVLTLLCGHTVRAGDRPAFIGAMLNRKTIGKIR